MWGKILSSVLPYGCDQLQSSSLTMHYRTEECVHELGTSVFFKSRELYCLYVALSLFNNTLFEV